MPTADTSATRPGWGVGFESPAGAQWLFEILADSNPAVRETQHLNWVDYSIFWQQYSGVYQVPKGLIAGPRIHTWTGRQQHYSKYRLSLELEPSDPNLYVYIGMAEYYSGRVEEAIHYLQQATDRVGYNNETPNLYLGMSLRDAGQFGAAPETFERMLEQNTENAWTADWAAECAFETGDRVKGQHYARIGWRAGQEVTYRGWRAGRI